jgi:MYXO-CTERM domain-containing protein
MTSALFLGLALTAAAQDTAEPPVVGGSASPSGKWPSVVAVVGNQGACTGTLVGPNTVVTAAHCGNAQGVVVNTTDYYNQSEGDWHPAAQTIRHPSYGSSQYGGYDIAVVRLTTPVTNFAPHPFATDCAADLVYDGAQGTIVGFGQTTQTGTGYNSRLHEAVLPIVDADCSDDYFCDPNMVAEGELFAGGDGVDACFGDSGGPLFVNYEGTFALVGVTSRSGSQATQQYPCRSGGIWTRADTLIGWIQQQTTDVLGGPICNAPPEVLVYPFGDVGNKGRYTTTYEIIDEDSTTWNYDIGQPTYGTVTIDGDRLVFEGDGSYVGPDAVTFIVTDDAGNVVDIEIPLNIVDGRVGCGCATGPGSAASWLFGLVGLVALRRRR